MTRQFSNRPSPTNHAHVNPQGSANPPPAAIPPIPPSPDLATRQVAGVPRTSAGLPTPTDTLRAAVPTLPATGGFLVQPTHSRFTWGHVLGQGGMATVIEARDAMLRRDVAMKTMRGGGTVERERLRFIEEAQITAQLQHPNIIPIYDIIESDDGQPVIAMKPIRGKTFADVIAMAHRVASKSKRGISGRMRPLLDVFLKVCDAVAFAHHQGIIHRDLKPQNIMVGEFGDVVVMDWGLAKPIGFTPDPADAKPAANPHLSSRRFSAPAMRDSGRLHGGGGVSTRKRSGTATVNTDRREQGMALTVVGTVQGTPAYMAPEQALGGTTLDEGCDIYALGAILYTILTNHLPIDGADTADQLSATIEHEIVSPRRRVPHIGIPKELEAVTMIAMARRRRDRFASVADLKAEIERFLDGQFLESVRYGIIQRLVKSVRMHPTITVSIASVIVFVALIGVTGTALVAQSERAERESAEKYRAHAQKEQAIAQAEIDRQRAVLAETREAMTRGEFDKVRRLVSAQTETKRDKMVEEFNRLWLDKSRRGINDDRFAVELGTVRLREFFSAFDRMIEVAGITGSALSAQDYFHRALILYLLGDYDRSVADYDRALQLDPNFEVAYLNRGNTHYANTNWAGAIADFTHLINHRPAASYFNNRGLARLANGEIEAAIADFDQAIRLMPTDTLALVNRGGARQSQGNYDAAIEDYSRAIDLDPNHAIAFNNRGNSRRAKGDLDGAIQDFSRAIELDARYAAAFANRGMAWRDKRNWAEAIADFSRSLDLQPSVTTFNNRGNARRANGDLDGAIADFTQCIALDPRFSLAYNNRGIAWRVKGNTAAAIADYNRAIELDPNYMLAFYNRGIAWRALREWDTAIDDFSHAIELDPNHIGALINRGGTRQDKGDTAGAVIDYDRALQLEQNNWQLWISRAKATPSTDRDGTLHALRQAYRYCTSPATKPQIADWIRQLGGTVPD